MEFINSYPRPRSQLILQLTRPDEKEDLGLINFTLKGTEREGGGKEKIECVFVGLCLLHR